MFPPQSYLSLPGHLCDQPGLKISRHTNKYKRNVRNIQVSLTFFSIISARSPLPGQNSGCAGPAAPLRQDFVRKKAGAPGKAPGRRHIPDGSDRQQPCKANRPRITPKGARLFVDALNAEDDRPGPVGAAGDHGIFLLVGLKNAVRMLPSRTQHTSRAAGRLLQMMHKSALPARFHCTRADRRYKTAMCAG